MGKSKKEKRKRGGNGKKKKGGNGKKKKRKVQGITVQAKNESK